MVDSQTYEVPDGYLYTKDHEWIRNSGKSSFLIGITDYAAKMLNDIVYVTLPREGTFLHQKDVYGQVESVKTVSDMYMPVSAKIIRTNSKLGQTPELVSNTPFTDGWMLEISPEDFLTESKELLDSDAYRKFIDTLKETD